MANLIKGRFSEFGFPGQRILRRSGGPDRLRASSEDVPEVRQIFEDERAKDFKMLLVPGGLRSALPRPKDEKPPRHDARI